MPDGDVLPPTALDVGEDGAGLGSEALAAPCDERHDGGGGEELGNGGERPEGVVGGCGFGSGLSGDVGVDGLSVGGYGDAGGWGAVLVDVAVDEVFEWCEFRGIDVP